MVGLSPQMDAPESRAAASTPSEAADEEAAGSVAVPSSDYPPSEPPPILEGEGLLWRIGGIVRTIRPHQWVKNVFVLAPVIFAKEIFAPLLLGRAFAAFGAFCLLAGAVYTINDLADIDADRRHPVKRHRPIPSGRVPVNVARGLAILLVVVALGTGLLLSLSFFAAAAAYFVLNLAYSARLKHVAYLDVSIIASGFVLRVVAGGFATQISVSAYLVACTAWIALFLGFGKRRHELTVASRRAALQRAALESYTRRGIDVALLVTGVGSIATYLAYTLDPMTQAFFRTDKLWYTTPLGVLGIWRFLQIVRSQTRAESPTQAMLSDGLFVAIVLVWAAIVMWFVYHLQPS
jgi:decaprenyl-phosphate phosphoribosyltransferase